MEGQSNTVKTPAGDAAIVHTALEAALNAACESIQTALGVTTGDFAGMYFSGDIADLELSVPTLRSFLIAQRRAHDNGEHEARRVEPGEDIGYGPGMSAPDDTPSLENCDDAGTGEGRFHGRM